MFRSIVIAAAIIGTAHTASAQQLTYNGLPLRQAFSTSLTPATAPAPQPSIAVPIQPTTRLSFAPRAASASKAGTTSKSFWHTPWPYVIAGAVAATIIVVAHNTGSSTTSGGGY
jgi:hypothetical protein